MSMNHFENTIQNNEKMVEFDAVYTLDSKVILKKLIKEELDKYGNNFTHLTTNGLNLKRIAVLAVFALITLVSIVSYFFYASIITCLIIIALTTLICILIFRKLTFENEIQKEAMNNPDMDIHSMVQEMIDQNQTVIMSPTMMFLLTGVLAIAIPLVLFYQPKTIYSTYQNGYTVARYTKGITNPEEITIPSTYKDKPVLAIDSGAFQASVIKYISLPQSIEYIGGEAFYNAKNLEQIRIPYLVTEIKGNTFENCKNLKAIYLSEYTTSIRGAAFKGCTSLTTITLPERITEIKGNTFENCTSLYSIEIPEGVTRIGGHAFYGCSSLTQVRIPSTVLEIGSSAFRCCDSLLTIKIPEEASVNERAFKESPTTIERY